MKLAIAHETHYRFQEPAVHSIQYLRLTPRDDPSQLIRSWTVATAGKLRSWTDGFGNHAGTTPMTMRKDALAAASALIVQFGQIARSVSDRAVLTAGIISVEPGGSNVVPGLARLTVDFRDLQRASVDRLADTIAAAARAVATEQGLQVDVEFEPTIPPSQLDDRIRQIISDAAAGRGLMASALPSGAGHDSQNLAALAPTGMIFVPSAGGRSHCPEEHTDWQDVENGANVLLDTVIALAEA